MGLDPVADSERAATGLPRPWPVDDRWLQALPQAVVALDVAGWVVGANGAAAKMLGLSSASLLGRKFTDVALDESQWDGFEEVLRLVLTGVGWDGELEVHRVDASGPTDLHLVPVSDGGTVTGAILVAEGVSGRRARAIRLSQRLARLGGVVAQLLYAADLETVTDIVVEHMADAAGATTASLSLLVDDKTLALIRLRGGPEGAVSRWATYSVDDDTPASEAVRTGRTIVLAGLDEIRSRYPHLDVAALGERSVVCLPLSAGDRAIGVASLSFPGKRSLDTAELDFFRIMADTCAQAVERIRAVERAADQAAQLEFLAQASAELASSLDHESTLRRVAWLAVPRFADWCAISLEQDGVLRTLAVAHSDPEKLSLAEEYQRLYPPDPESPSGAYEVLRSGRSQLTAEVTEEMLRARTPDPTQLRMLRDLNFRSGLIVPLKARGRTLGTITWVSGEAGRRFTSSDVGFGEEIARRAAVAIDNALLHSELRDVADRLQQAVLPRGLPAVPGWELGALYQSGGRTAVGGDFYDAIPLQDDRLALFIGDVMGLGIPAAAAMSQVSAALRALVAVDPEPASVLSRLDLLFERFPTEQLVTLLYAVADPSRDKLVVACAGHPPPLVLDPDGRGTFVESARGLILGAGGAQRQQAVVPFSAGQTLLLYTDGLLERRGEDLNVGKQRLLDAVSRFGARSSGFSSPGVSGQAPGGLESSLAALARSVRDQSHDDDMAMLAAWRLP